MLITEVSLIVPGVGQDNNSGRASSTLPKNFLVEIHRESREKSDHKGPHMSC